MRPRLPVRGGHRAARPATQVPARRPEHLRVQPLQTPRRRPPIRPGGVHHRTHSLQLRSRPRLTHQPHKLEERALRPVARTALPQNSLSVLTPRQPPRKHAGRHTHRLGARHRRRPSPHRTDNRVTNSRRQNRLTETTTHRHQKPLQNATLWVSVRAEAGPLRPRGTGFASPPLLMSGVIGGCVWRGCRFRRGPGGWRGCGGGRLRRVG
jgi:hypothetical protein